MKRITLLLTLAAMVVAADALGQPSGYYWCGHPSPPPSPPQGPPCLAPPPPCDCESSASNGAPSAPGSDGISLSRNRVGGAGGGSGGSGGPGSGGGCDACTGSPCFVSSGSYIASAVDLQMPTVGFPLEASRSYQSGRPADSILGVGWTLNLASHLYYATYLYSAPNTYQHEADAVMPGGGRHRFTQNSDGTFTPPVNRYDTLMHNADGTFDLTISDGSARYHFADDGRLQTLSDEFGNELTYTYDASNRLQQVADAAGSGRYLDVYFGADGRVSTIQDHTGRQIQYRYDSRGTLTSVIDAAGRATSYAYQQVRFAPLLTRISDNWGRVITDVTYDSQGRTKTYTEEGETYTYTYGYNNNPNQVSKVDSVGNRWVYIYALSGPITFRQFPGGATQQTVYNSDDSIQQVTDEVGVVTSYTYDRNARFASVTRDVGGPQAVRFDYSYDPNFPSKLTAVVPKNPSTGVYDPNWQTWQYDYYQTGSAAPGALYHIYRLHDDGVTVDTVATYTYNTQGQALSLTDAAGVTTTYTYDGAGNLGTVSMPPNNDAGTSSLTTYGYDGVGRLISVADPLGHSTSYAYDVLDRLTTATLPKPSPGFALNFTTTYAYDSYDPTSQLLTKVTTDPNGVVTSQRYDVFGRVVSITDGLGNVTGYGYARARLASIADANGNTTLYGYDGLARLTSTTFPDSAVESYAYTADGLLQTKTDRDGHTITYSYDHLKRLATKSYGSAGAVALTFQGQKLIGVYDTSLSPSESHTFAYDHVFRPTSVTQGARGTVSYTYTPTNAIATYAVAGGAGATYTYYPSGALSTIQWSPVSGLFKYIYTLAGQYATLSFPNGQNRTYRYDDQGRLTQIANVHPTVGNLATYSYGYDVNNADGTLTRLGQRTSTTADVPAQGLSGAVTKYYYDNKYQLIGVDYPNATPFSAEHDAWTWDAIGNRLTATVGAAQNTYTYQRAGTSPNNWQRLLNDGTNNYTYDANGNTLTRGGLTFQWDAENHLLSVSGSGNGTFAYDYQGRRTSASGTASVYERVNRVHDMNGVDYMLGPSGDDPLAMSSPSAGYYAVDGAASVVLVTNDSGSVVNSYLYDVWGGLRNSSEASPQPFRYTGREDAPAGMLFYRARYLQTDIGRFLSEDPLRWLAGADFYLYVHGDPVNYLDPFGLDDITNDPNVRKCLCQLWKDANYGRDPNQRERAMWITKDPQGVRDCIRWPWTATSRQETWRGQVPSTAVAIMHIHPQGTDPVPPDADRDAANKAGVPNYACSVMGIWKVDPNCTNGPRHRPCPPERVEDSTWQDWCH